MYQNFENKTLLLHARIPIALCKINFNNPFENNLEIQTSLSPIANVCQYFTLRCPDHYSTVHSLKIDSNVCVQQAAILGHGFHQYIPFDAPFLLFYVALFPPVCYAVLFKSTPFG